MILFLPVLLCDISELVRIVNCNFKNSISTDHFGCMQIACLNESRPLLSPFRQSGLPYPEDRT